MSVLIKGMEMPESCLECPFKWAGDSTTYCLAQTPTMKSLMPVKLHEIRWKKFSNAVEKFRWKEASCPLAPVPPHGRLIDADELMHEFEKAQRTMAQHGREYSCSFMSSGQEISTEWYCVEDMLENAPTIIPAEEGET